jgi:nucleoside-diphosphate-sugar epimerase
MKILVTGGLGLVGKSVVARLLASGHAVKVIDRLAESTLEGIEYVCGDVNDFAAVRQAVQGQEAIIHLAAIPHPGGPPGHEIFRINCAGTFNLYEAAAQEGIRRISTASSINWLGFYYGCKEYEVKYLPIDEDHPNFTTEPYSFSKQVTEDIAAYYWRREGISSTCLRLPGVIEPDPEWLPRVKEWRTHMLAIYQSWFDMPEDERQARVARMLAEAQALRAQRVKELPIEEQQQRGIDAFSNGDVRLEGFRANFWALVDARDAAQAFEKSLLADFEGFHPLFVNDAINSAGIESELLARTFYPAAGRSRPLVGSEALISIARARQLIGFEPEFSFAKLFEG